MMMRRTMFWDFFFFSHKAVSHKENEQLSVDLLIQNRLQYSVTISPPLSLMSARPVLPSFSWFHTLWPNIGADMSRNKKPRIVSLQTIASTAVICVMLPRRPAHILPIRTNTVQMAAEVLALISSLIGRSLCFSSGYLTCRVAHRLFAVTCTQIPTPWSHTSSIQR